MTTKQNQVRRGKLTLISLLLLFSAPVVISWILINYSDIGRDGGAASHGELVVPPRPLADVNLQNPLDPEIPVSLHGKWSLLYISENDCDMACVENVYRMRQIRLALDKDSLRVQRVLLIPSSVSADTPAEKLKDFPGQLLLDAANVDQQFMDKFRLQEGMDPWLAGNLYVIDSSGNLMMYYPPESDPSGIIGDLKRLLKYSRI